MYTKDITREHLEPVLSTWAKRINHNYVDRCAWSPLSSSHRGIVLLLDPDDPNRASKLIGKVRGEDVWYMTYNTGPFEGPYEFDQMLTLAMLEGYIEAY